MRKKWMLLLLAGLLLVQTAGCSGKKENQESGEIQAEEPEAGTSDSVESRTEAESEVEQTTQEDAIAFHEAELSCELPKGFQAYPEEEGLYVYKNYPKDISTISYVISESEENITQMSQDEFKRMLEADYQNAYGDQVVIEITQFETITVSKRPGIKVMMAFEFKGVVYEQLMYMLYNGNESHLLCYTQEKGGKWMEEFAASGDTITFN